MAVLVVVGAIRVLIRERIAELLLRWAVSARRQSCDRDRKVLYGVGGRLLLAAPLALSGCAAHAPASAQAVAPEPQAELAIVTWNMNAGRGDLPRLVSDLAAGRLSGPPPRAYALLLQEAVDQDGDPPPTLGRVQQRGLAMVFAPVREVGGRMRGNAIIASIPLLDTRTIVLPRERQPRSAVAATVSILGGPLLLVSVHLENRLSWRRGGLFSAGARARQVSALIAALPPGEPGIVGGDLNTWLGPAEPAWQQMLRRFPDTPPPRSTDATFRKRLVLDHLFFDVPDAWHIRRMVLPDAYGSDHSPVLGLVYG